MSGTDWSREEVEAIIDDYLAMLAAELAGVRYNKAAHRRELLPRLGATPSSLSSSSTPTSAPIMTPASGQQGH